MLRGCCQQGGFCVLLVPAFSRLCLVIGSHSAGTLSRLTISRFPQQCFPVHYFVDLFCLFPKLPPSSFCQLCTFNSFSHAASTFPGPRPAGKSLHHTRDTRKRLSLAGQGQLLALKWQIIQLCTAQLLHLPLTRWTEETEHYI